MACRRSRLWALGLLIGGSLASRLGKRNLRWYSLIPAIGMFACVPIYLVAFQATDLTVSVTLIILAGTSLVLHYGPGHGDRAEPRDASYSSVDDGAATCSW